MTIWSISLLLFQMFFWQLYLLTFSASLWCTLCSRMVLYYLVKVLVLVKSHFSFTSTWFTCVYPLCILYVKWILHSYLFVLVHISCLTRWYYTVAVFGCTIIRYLNKDCLKYSFAIKFNLYTGNRPPFSQGSETQHRHRCSKNENKQKLHCPSFPFIYSNSL